MTDNLLVDLFGELEFGTFENDNIEKDLDNFVVRIKKRIKGIFQSIRANLKKIITIGMGICAFLAFAISIIVIIVKKSKRVKVAA